jgi:hypothetical protein
MKKQFLPLAIVTAMIAAPSYSQPSGDSKGAFTISPAYVSTYMSRGLRKGGETFLPAVDYDRGPLALTLRAKFLVDKKIAYSNYPECDFYASYEWTITPDAFKITPGVTVLTWPTLDDDAHQMICAPNLTFEWAIVPDVFKIAPSVTVLTWPMKNETDDAQQMICEPSLSFGYTAKGLIFSLIFYYDVELKGTTYDFGADYSIPVEPLGIELNFSARTGTYKWTDTLLGTEIIETANYWSAGVAVPYTFSGNLKLTAGWLYSMGFYNHHKASHVNKLKNIGAVDRGVISASLSYSF